MAKNKGARPPLWTDPKALEALIDLYFEEAVQPTLAGLAYSIGIDRGTLYNYEKKDEFFHTIKEARDRMLRVYEGLLIYQGKANVAGIIFALKNTGWSDKTDITSGGEAIRPILGGITKDDSNTSDNETGETSKED